MTLSTLVISIAITALILTLIIGLTTKSIKNWIISYLQNFCGALFVFSGWVKAIDPLGTAFKMEQYFAEFEAAFSGTWFSFLAPLFPWLSKYAISFSVGMIVFEIVLGILLLIGGWRKFTAWAFFLLVAFFTFLTGFTYLTGYVPSDPVYVVQNVSGETREITGDEVAELEGAWKAIDTIKVNFFQFGKWGPYVATNMKVTDCGCFGDFLVLEPKVSFLKDVFLLIPALVFLFFWRQKHQLFSAPIRTGIVLLSTTGLILYCFSNYKWDLPHADFRPFREGRNIRLERNMEEIAGGNIQTIAYELTNKASGEKKIIPVAEYLQTYKDYPKDSWDSEQITSEPSIQLVKSKDAPEGYVIPAAEGEDFEQELVKYLKGRWKIASDTFTKVVEPTKISDFEAGDANGNDKTYDILNEEGYSFMIIAYKLKADEVSTTTRVVEDSIYVVDTLAQADSIILTRRLDRVDKRQVEEKVYTWNNHYLEPWVNQVNPVMEAAAGNKIPVFAITALAEPEKLNSFREITQSTYPFYTADDIMLKTIIRSNPGVVLLKKGEIIQKWHYSKLPPFATIQSQYMK
ncbi:MAG TPA: DoxX family protein [Saprospiraceae bacterium]|nr:DoxX family protein [Saprospiraceae bacterium]HMQ83166.1 DoxX family protein [Saprospiraceae bacterium]